MRIRPTIIMFLVFISCNLFAQQRTFVNPGIKLGYAFGKNNGFVFGLEISIVQHSEDSFIYGAVASVDIIKDAVILHVGLETTSPWIIGLEAGPSLLLKNGKKKFGIGITPYAGFILLPFINYSWFSKNQSYLQFGSYLKIPILISGRRCSFGG